MKRITVLAGAVATIGLHGCAGTTASLDEPVQVAEVRAPLSVSESTYFVEMPFKDNKVYFFGQPKPKEVAKAGGSILYPGDTAAMFFASILAHSMISSSVQGAEEKARIEEANAILEPYQSSLDKVSAAYLHEYAVAQSARSHDAEIAMYSEGMEYEGFRTTMEPVFIMSRSTDSLAIRAEVKIFSSDEAPDDPVYERTVHLHSEPHAETPTDGSHWLGDGSGTRLLSTVYSLSRDALVYAIRDYQGEFDTEGTRESTIRYRMNGAKIVERGKFINDETCGFIVFESLRDELKRVQSLDGCLQQAAPSVETAPQQEEAL
ncbi:MAG: hypothetical protein AAF578_02715 [Pseudomonadota bacterium]